MAEHADSAPCAVGLVGPTVPAGPELFKLREAGFAELLLCQRQPTPAALASGLPWVRSLGPEDAGAVLAVLLLCRAPQVLVLPSERLASTPMAQLAGTDPRADVVLERRDQLLPGRYGAAARRPLERALRRGEAQVERLLRGLRLVCLEP